MTNTDNNDNNLTNCWDNEPGAAIRSDNQGIQ